MGWAIGLAIILGGSGLRTKAQTTVNKLAPGDEAPAFTLKVLNPKRTKARLVALKRYVGPQADMPHRVVLSFAASYCGPCKAELVEFKKLAPALERSKIELVVVVTDQTKKGQQLMKELTIDTLDLPFKVVSDRFGIVSRRYQAEALPKTVVIGKDGRVTWVAQGFDAGSMSQFKKHLGI